MLHVYFEKNRIIKLEISDGEIFSVTLLSGSCVSSLHLTNCIQIVANESHPSFPPSTLTQLGPLSWVEKRKKNIELP